MLMMFAKISNIVVVNSVRFQMIGLKQFICAFVEEKIEAIQLREAAKKEGGRLIFFFLN